MKLRVRPKKKCCRSDPRCKRCPVVCKRLLKGGHAKRLDDGIVVIRADLTKKQYRAARAR